MSGLCCRRRLGWALASVSGSEFPLPALLCDAGAGALCKLRFPQAPGSRLPVRLCLWKVLEGDRKAGGGAGLPPCSSSCQHHLGSRGEPLPQPAASFGPLRTSRRATSPQRPKRQPAAPPAVVRAPAKPRSPPRPERQPRPRPEVRPPPAKQRPPQKAKQQPRSSPQRGPGTSRGGSPVKEIGRAHV